MFRFDAERMEVVRRDFPAREACWDPVDYKPWLLPSSHGPVDGPVLALAEKITKGRRSLKARAKAIYDWTCENTYRDPDTRGCGVGDVLQLLKKPSGKCTDIHSVFVTLCRAAGVPAREIFGIRMGKKTVMDITKWEHCWAEFYLPGYGWVPVDPADVRKIMHTHNLTLNDPETQKWRDYFWGAWDPYRIKLAVGRDLILSPPQAGPSLNNFGYPYAEVSGVPLDWLAPETFMYKITFNEK
jgi:transglutaminase-like putative cysteine protease